MGMAKRHFDEKKKALVAGKGLAILGVRKRELGAGGKRGDDGRQKEQQRRPVHAIAGRVAAQRSKRLEQAAHNDRVPQLAAGPAVLPDPPPFLGEAALAVERDRGRIVGEHLQAEFVQPLAAGPVDRRLHQRRPHPPAAPGAVDQHPELTEPVAAGLDVDHPDPGRNYSIPKDNPFVGVPDARPEIYAYGFRNPWRFSFDPHTGQPWVGNVGQDLWEMILLVNPGDNFGWSVMEGTHPFHPNARRGPGPFVAPVVENFGSARIKDISLDGIGLVVGRRVEPGSLLALTVANPPRSFTKTLLIRVIHATQQPGGYLVGGKFQTPLTYQELTMIVM